MEKASGKTAKKTDAKIYEMSKMKLRTCPQCGSRNIKMTVPVGIMYKCETCGYTGNFVVEQDVDKRFKK